MLEKIKGFISSLLTVAVVVSYICTPVSAQMYIDEVVYDEACTALSRLGFITYTKGKIPADEKMTRLEFVELMSEVLGDGFAKDGENVFSDVYPGSEEAKILASAYSMNLIRGYGSEFRPDEEISYYDAVVIAVKAIGYSAIEDYLSYTADYLSIAKNADLLDNIANKNDNFSKADAYMLIYNTIKADMFVQVGFGSESRFAREEGKTILSEYHDVQYIEGQVTKTRVTGLVSDQICENGIEISADDGTVISALCSDEYNDTIGMKVNALYRDNGKDEPEIISISINEKKLNIITITGDRLVGVNPDTREIRYEEASEGDKTGREKKEIIPITANWLYNGQYVENVKTDVLQRLQDALNFTGDLNVDKIQMVDLDNDRKIDIVKVDMYKSLVLDHISTNGINVDIGSQNPHSPLLGEGYIERNSLLNGAVVADYNGKFDLYLTDDKTYYIHSENEQEIDITNLAKFSVLSVKEGLGEKPYVEVCVTDERVEGNIISKNGEYEITLEDSNIYTVANVDDLSSVYEMLIIGKSYEFLLDIQGNIAGWITKEQISKKMDLGFVLRAKYDTENMTTAISVFVPEENQDGNKGVKKLYTDDKLVIDGVRMEAGYDASGVSGKLIRYRLNDDGRIVTIETPDAEPRDGQLQYFVKDPAVRQTVRDNYLYFKFGMNIFVNENYLSGSLAMDEDTIILLVPNELSDTNDWEFCTQMRYEDFTRTTDLNDQPFVADGYVYDDDSVVCDVIVLRQIEDFMPFDKTLRVQPMVIDKVYTRWSEEDSEEILIIRGADTTGTKNLYCRGKDINIINGFNGRTFTYTTKPSNAIHKGDVIIPYCDELGRLVAVMVLYSYSGETTVGDPTSLLTANGNKSTACYTGYVERIDEPFMIFREARTDEKWLMSIRRDSGATVTVYDTETQEARPGTYLDLASSRGKVFVKAFNSRVVTQIFIFI